MRGSCTIESSVAAGAKGAISPAGHVAAGANGGQRGRGGGGDFSPGGSRPAASIASCKVTAVKFSAPPLNFSGIPIYSAVRIYLFRGLSLSPFPRSAPLSRSFALSRFLGRLSSPLFLFCLLFYRTSRTRPSPLSLSRGLSLPHERDGRLLHTLDFKRKGTR